MIQYSKTSPYYNTTSTDGFLNVLQFRDIPFSADDIFWSITKTYENRPDLLAYDLYGDVNLWWVFAVRNPSIIPDPIFDMKAGVKIYLPQKPVLNTALGL